MNNEPRRDQFAHSIASLTFSLLSLHVQCKNEQDVKPALFYWSHFLHCLLSSLCVMHVVSRNPSACISCLQHSTSIAWKLFRIDELWSKHVRVQNKRKEGFSKANNCKQTVAWASSPARVRWRTVWSRSAMLSWPRKRGNNRETLVHGANCASQGL